MLHDDVAYTRDSHNDRGNTLNLNIFHLIVPAAWTLICRMAPYLLVGFTLSAVIGRFLNAAWIREHLGGRKAYSVPLASLLGVPAPLCSCGVLPLASSLWKRGAGRGPVLGFLTSTPLTGLDSMLVVYAVLGIGMAVTLPLTAFAGGCLVGWLVMLFGGKRQTEDVEREGSQKASWAGAFRHAFLNLPHTMAKPLLLGILLAALAQSLLPEQLLPAGAGESLMTKLLILACATPVYICSMGAIPLAAALMHTGFSAGAIIVFLIAGPATNLAALTTIARLMGMRTAIVFLSGVIVFCLAAGTLVDTFGWVQLQVGSGHAHHAEELSWVHTLSGTVLLIWFLGVILHDEWEKRRKAPNQ